MTPLVLAVLASSPGAAQAAAACSSTPTDVAPGETVTLDASATENASSVEFDVDGDGVYDQVDRTDFVVEVTYQEPGTYEPGVRATGSDGNDTATAACDSVTVSRNQPPRAQLVADPATGTVGEFVYLDATESTDPDGEIVQYRFDLDGDGTVDRVGDGPTVEHAYDAAGTHLPTVTVLDEDGASATATAEVTVEGNEPRAACEVDPTSIQAGESVTIDATASRNVETVGVDVDGDGTIDRRLAAPFQTSVTYEEPGTVEPTVTASSDAGETLASCAEVAILAANASSGSDGGNAKSAGGGLVGSIADAAGIGDGGPGSLPHVGGTVLLLGAVGWLASRVERTTDDPRPRGVFEWRSDLDERFAAGLRSVDGGEAVEVDIDFEPDLVLLTARPTLRNDAAADDPVADLASDPAATAPHDPAPGARSVSNGVALRTDAGIAQHSVGATWTDGDGATVIADGSAVSLTEDALGSLTETSAQGFVFEAAADLDADVLYRAVRLPSRVDVTIGTAAVAAGVETVDLGVDCGPDVLLLDAIRRGNSPSGDGIACVGTAVGRGVDQAAVRQESASATVVLDRVLDLGADGPRAAVDSGTGRVILAYDDPVDDEHWLQFAAFAGTPAFVPATGTAKLSGGDGTTVDVGFRPALLEYWHCAGDESASDPAVSVCQGAVARSPDESDRSGLDHSVLGWDRRAVGSAVVDVSLTDDGFALTAADEASTEPGGGTLAYRAWPEPLADRGDGGDRR